MMSSECIGGRHEVNKWRAEDVLRAAATVSRWLAGTPPAGVSFQQAATPERAMPQLSPFPSDREAKRAALLAAVGSLRELLTRDADEAETRATLSPDTVKALVTSRLLTLKLPAVLGGAEADPVTQIDVLEALSAIDPSVGWCGMTGATALGLPGAFLADEAIAEMFAGGRIPTGAVVAMPGGKLVPDGTGWRLTGRWPFASGVRHAEWITLGAVAPAKGGGAPSQRFVTLPTSAIRIHDNWDVAGLRGTGSCDVSVEDHHVPHGFSWDRMTDPPRRGGPLYRLPPPGFVANEHAAFALGIGRAALQTVMDLARSKRRSFVGAASSLESRPVFQRMVGESDLKLRAARALVVEINAEVWAALEAGSVPTLRQQAEMRSVAVHATDVATEVSTAAFRYAGGSAVHRANPLQRYLRDINVAAQHLMVSDIAYETHGMLAMGLDADPMR
jgi:alkylation response protein AidB-like acyl-CoA dehydrogenase